MSNPWKSASVNYNDKRKSQKLALEDAQYGFVESRREQVRLPEELSLKEKGLRDTQIRNMHEMGQIQRAREHRVDELSVRAKKPRSSPWKRKNEDFSYRWRHTKSRHNSNADICDKAVDCEFYNAAGGITAELHGRTDVGISIRQIRWSTIFFGVEVRVKNQVTTCYDFTSNVMLLIEVEMVDS